MENLVTDIFVDPTVRCLFIKSVGTLTRVNGFELADFARQDKRYENDFDVLTDITECTVEISPEGLRQLAIYIDQNWPCKQPIKSAYVVSGPLNYGMARIYGAYSSNRVSDPIILNGKQPDIEQKIKTLYNFPNDYKIPDFFKY